MSADPPFPFVAYVTDAMGDQGSTTFRSSVSASALAGSFVAPGSVSPYAARLRAAPR